MYRLEYLPVATQDMVEIARYIGHVLCNPTAAERLSHQMIEAADKLAAFPYSNPVHATIRPLKREYRKLIIQNYIMFYWIDEAVKQITVARVIYARRDYETLAAMREVEDMENGKIEGKAYTVKEFSEML